MDLEYDQNKAQQSCVHKTAYVMESIDGESQGYCKFIANTSRVTTVLN